MYIYIYREREREIMVIMQRCRIGAQSMISTVLHRLGWVRAGYVRHRVYRSTSYFCVGARIPPPPMKLFSMLLPIVV